MSVVDRLPVVTSLNDGESKLLSVPQLSSGTGQEAANNVTQHLASWNLSEHPSVLIPLQQTQAQQKGLALY